MARNQEKSLFLHCEKDVWDCLTKETRLREVLAEQLATADLEPDELAPAGRELADL